MTRTRKIQIRLVALTLGAAAILVPFSVSPGSDTPVEVTEACADNKCCIELGSTCEKDDVTAFNYYPTTESCGPKRQE